jgi:hydrogenase nickel incorporation protein HypA/HybF
VGVVHEIGLCEGVLDRVLRRAKGRPVRRVRVRIGALHAVDEESMAQGFRLVAQGTEAAGAALDVVSSPARIICGECGFEADTHDLAVFCPRCHGRVGLLGGDDLVLEYIEYTPTGEAAGPAANAPAIPEVMPETLPETKAPEPVRPGVD